MVNLRSYRTTVMFLGILVLLTVTVFRNNCKQLHKNLYCELMVRFQQKPWQAKMTDTGT